MSEALLRGPRALRSPQLFGPLSTMGGQTNSPLSGAIRDHSTWVSSVRSTTERTSCLVPLHGPEGPSDFTKKTFRSFLCCDQDYPTNFLFEIIAFYCFPMGLIFTRSSSHISSFQLFIFFSGAACEVPLLGSLDQVAAHWQGARRVPGLPGELPQTGVGHWTKTKTNTKSQSQPKGLQRAFQQLVH